MKHYPRTALLGKMVALAIATSACSNGDAATVYERDAYQALSWLKSGNVTPEQADRFVATIDTARNHVPNLKIDRDEVEKLRGDVYMERSQTYASMIRNHIAESWQYPGIVAKMNADAKVANRPAPLNEGQIAMYKGQALGVEMTKVTNGATVPIAKTRLAALNRKAAAHDAEKKVKAKKPKTTTAKKRLAAKHKAAAR